MDILKSVLYGVLEYIVDLLKITLHACTHWFVEILSSTFNAGVTYLLDVLEHSLIIIIACLLKILRFFINNLIDLSTDLVSWAVRFTIGITIPSIKLLLEGLYQAYLILVDIIMNSEYISQYDLIDAEYDLIDE